MIFFFWCGKKKENKKHSMCIVDNVPLLRISEFGDNVSDTILSKLVIELFVFFMIILIYFVGNEEFYCYNFFKKKILNLPAKLRWR